MIRIDEIYSHTFWPWIEKKRPGTRLFFCDPFGHTQPDTLYNHGSDYISEHDYVFCHDQEPIQLDAHRSLFQEVIKRNIDLADPMPPGHVVVSERGEMVNRLTAIYGWKSHYYFFHGWACLDWYRGYNHTFLLAPPEMRSPTRAFMSPNRIIGGERDHRVLFVYHCQKLGLNQNHVSAPQYCPYEKLHILDIAREYRSVYPDIEQVLSEADLPWLLPGEHTQQMTSCWLDNIETAMDSTIYVPTETVYFGRRTHITEKTFKAVALGMPFILVAAAHSLEYMREYGFRTFAHVWDESYDQESDDIQRLQKVADLLAGINNLGQRELISLHRHCLPVVTHNWNHFYHGGFEQVLWAELQAMLQNL